MYVFLLIVGMFFGVGLDEFVRWIRNLMKIAKKVDKK